MGVIILEKNTNAAFESNFVRLYLKIYPYELNEMSFIFIEIKIAPNNLTFEMFC